MPFHLALIALTVAGFPANAQPKAIEVYATTGYIRYSLDTAFDGRGIFAGGTAVLPVKPRFAIEADVHSGEIKFKDRFGYRPDYTHRVTMLAITPVARFGNERIYGFAGVGIAGAVRDRYGAGFVQGRGGVVVSPTSHFVIRGEFGAAAALGHDSVQEVKLSLGYRF